MDFTAKISFARIAPRKFRYVVDLVRGQNINRALDILKVVPNRGAFYLNKVLRSALANASHLDEEVDTDTLVVSRAEVGCGPIVKRWQPAPMGRACAIKKRTAHVWVTLTAPPADEKATAEAKGKEKAKGAAKGKKVGETKAETKAETKPEAKKTEAPAAGAPAADAKKEEKKEDKKEEKK